jgi:dephospho-CoA kinase
VNRREVGRIVFQDDEARRFLNRTAHPIIRERIREAIEARRRDGRTPLIVLDAALLLEAGIEDWCDALIFVEADRPAREARARQHRDWDAQELTLRERAQLDPEEKRGRCDFTIDNRRSLDETRRQVCELFERLAAPCARGGFESRGSER